MLVGRARTADGVRDVRWSADGPVPIESPLAAFAAGRAARDVGDPIPGAVLVAPVAPTLLIGIAQNGPGHASPVQAWLKSPRTVVPSGTAVRLRRDAGTPVAEGEIAVVLGRDARGLTAENAHEYVWGVTAVNDLSSPDRNDADPRNFESKSGAGYTPLGPWIDTEADIGTVPLALRIDGRLRGETTAAALPVAIAECLAYLAGWTPLGPGDVVMTGAPFTQVPIEPGQRVEVAVGAVRLITPTL